MKEYCLKGSEIVDLNSFFKMFGEMIYGANWYFGKDLQSFDDCLFGGYELESPCRIIWNDSFKSKESLSYDCYASYCQDLIKRGNFPDEEALAYVQSELELAHSRRKTMFDVINDIIQTVEKRSGGRCKITLELS